MSMKSPNVLHRAFSLMCGARAERRKASKDVNTSPSLQIIPGNYESSLARDNPILLRNGVLEKSETLYLNGCSALDSSNRDIRRQNKFAFYKQRMLENLTSNGDLVPEYSVLIGAEKRRCFSDKGDACLKAIEVTEITESAGSCLTAEEDKWEGEVYGQSVNELPHKDASLSEPSDETSETETENYNNNKSESAHAVEDDVKQSPRLCRPQCVKFKEANNVVHVYQAEKSVTSPQLQNGKFLRIDQSKYDPAAWNQGDKMSSREQPDSEVKISIDDKSFQDMISSISNGCAQAFDPDSPLFRIHVKWVPSEDSEKAPVKLPLPKNHSESENEKTATAVSDFTNENDKSTPARQLSDPHGDNEVISKSNFEVQDPSSSGALVQRFGLFSPLRPSNKLEKNQSQKRKETSKTPIKTKKKSQKFKYIKEQTSNNYNAYSHPHQHYQQHAHVYDSHPDPYHSKYHANYSHGRPEVNRKPKVTFPGLPEYDSSYSNLQQFYPATHHQLYHPHGSGDYFQIGSSSPRLHHHHHHHPMDPAPPPHDHMFQPHPQDVYSSQQRKPHVQSHFQNQINQTRLEYSYPRPEEMRHNVHCHPQDAYRKHPEHRDPQFFHPDDRLIRQQEQAHLQQCHPHGSNQRQMEQRHLQYCHSPEGYHKHLEQHHPQFFPLQESHERQQSVPFLHPQQQQHNLYYPPQQAVRGDQFQSVNHCHSPIQHHHHHLHDPCHNSQGMPANHGRSFPSSPHLRRIHCQNDLHPLSQIRNADAADYYRSYLSKSDPNVLNEMATQVDNFTNMLKANEIKIKALEESIRRARSKSRITRKEQFRTPRYEIPPPVHLHKSAAPVFPSSPVLTRRPLYYS